jgi:hypothetical protein
LCKALSGEPLRELCNELWSDRFMPVRREALYAVAEKLPKIADTHLRLALVDSHISMREAARFYLRKRGEEDFSAFYRNRLTSSDREDLAVAIAGVGETGRTQDAALGAPFLGHAEPRVRCAAVRAVARLDPDAFWESFLHALQDASPSVAKAARAALLERPHALSAEKLWSIFNATDKAHVRRIVLSMIAQLRWWDCAPLLVLAQNSSHRATRLQATEHLRRWKRNIGRLYVRPSRTQLKMLEDALKHAASSMDRSLRDDLESLYSYAARESQ